MSTKLQAIGAVNSCWNRAKFDEQVFVLLGRDESAQIAIHAWIKDRIRRGKNSLDDPQIAEALDCIRQIEVDLAKAGKGVMPPKPLTEEEGRNIPSPPDEPALVTDE